jgi:hypothetical protein
MRSMRLDRGRKSVQLRSMEWKEKPLGTALTAFGLFVLVRDVPHGEDCRPAEMCMPVADVPPHNHEEPRPVEPVPVIKLAISSSAGGWNGGPLIVNRPWIASS